ncbi:heavy-metal-associated domain-containing protein [Candidatus Woesearchaeota archaeon]|nr:heavy-metal-associated domain-containing protein [Candidatus Woesearchaeota archaeon]
MKKVNLEVKGMHCPSCEMLIKDIIEDEEGVKTCTATMKNNSVEIEFEETQTDLDHLKEIIASEGYEVK